MNLKDFPRTFFLLFNDGDTFYFTLNSPKEIQCTRFKNIYENTKSKNMPLTSVVEFIGNEFVLKNNKGEVVYSLKEYRKALSKILPTTETEQKIERIYIDDDVRDYLLSEELIKYDEESANIPGLLYKLPEENKTTSYTRKKVKTSRI